VTELSAYVLAKLREGEFTLYRVLGNGLASILLVTPAGEYPSPGSLQHLEHEYALRADLDADWAARPVRLVRREAGLMLVLEDPGGEPLERLLGRPMEVGQFLRIAVPLAAAIGQIWPGRRSVSGNTDGLRPLRATPNASARPLTFSLCPLVLHFCAPRSCARLRSGRCTLGAGGCLWHATVIAGGGLGCLAGWSCRCERPARLGRLADRRLSDDDLERQPLIQVMAGRRGRNPSQTLPVISRRLPALARDKPQRP
jgi:hypothetical protein